MQLLRALSPVEVKRELLDTVRVLLPPQFDQKRRQDFQEHPGTVDAGMTPAADSNKVAVVGNSRPPMMHRERTRAATRIAAGLAESTIPLPDPLAPAAEEAPIEPMPGVAASAESTGQQIPFPAGPAPQVVLPIPLAGFRDVWSGRHSCCAKYLQNLCASYFLTKSGANRA